MRRPQGMGGAANHSLGGAGPLGGQGGAGGGPELHWEPSIQQKPCLLRKAVSIWGVGQKARLGLGPEAWTLDMPQLPPHPTVPMEKWPHLT